MDKRLRDKRLVCREERQHYLNVGTTAEPVWALLGEGFTEFTEALHPVCCQRRYIHEPVKRTDVTGYAPVVDYAFEVYTDSPAIEKLRQIADRELTGCDAWVELCTVDLFDETAVSGVCRATVRTYSVIPDTCGEGTDALTYTGTLRAVSAPVQGTFVVSAGKFQKA